MAKHTFVNHGTHKAASIAIKARVKSDLPMHLIKMLLSPKQNKTTKYLNTLSLYTILLLFSSVAYTQTLSRKWKMHE